MMIWKIHALLEDRGVADFDAAGDFRIEDHGAGPKLVTWDKVKLGPKPTMATLDALATRAAEIQAEAQADPTDDLYGRLRALKGTSEIVDQLIDVMTGEGGRGRIAARPVQAP